MTNEELAALSVRLRDLANYSAHDRLNAADAIATLQSENAAKDERIKQADAENAELRARLEVARAALEKLRQYLCGVNSIGSGARYVGEAISALAHAPTPTINEVLKK